MKILHLISVLAIVLVVGCSEEETIEAGCLASMLQDNEMVEYDGQEVGCKTHLILYHLEGQQFFIFANACALLESYPIDCKGNTMCMEEGIPACPEFLDHAELIGIVGISK